MTQSYDWDSHPVGTLAVNPRVEDAYWRENYFRRDYADQSRSYTDYRPAYKYGWESHSRLSKRPFQAIEGELERGWDKVRGESRLAWEYAKHATSDAWHRIEHIAHADATNRRD